MDELRGRFVSNRHDVAAKVIDGELIIIRLVDGTYYSMENAGTHVWELVVAGHPLDAVVETLGGWYGLPAARVRDDVTALVRELFAEGLIVAAPDGADAPPVVAPPADTPDYEAPRLQIYRDMGNLLALDPPTPGIDDLLFRNPKDD